MTTLPEFYDACPLTSNTTSDGKQLILTAGTGYTLCPLPFSSCPVVALQLAWQKPRELAPPTCPWPVWANSIAPVCQHALRVTCGSPGVTSWRKGLPGHTNSGSGTGSPCVSHWSAGSSGKSSSPGSPGTRCAQRPD